MRLPEPQRTQLKLDARAYADAVIDHDWPQMADDKIPEASHVIDEAMWKTVMTIKPDSQTAVIYTDHALSQLTTLTEHRRTRMLQAAYKLPPIFWAVLIAGGLVTVLSAATFGARSTALHAFQVTSFTLLVTLVLLAIGDVNRPFQGWIHIDNYAFIRARTYMVD